MPELDVPAVGASELDPIGHTFADTGRLATGN
jgi:hypothetical protein